MRHNVMPRRKSRVEDEKMSSFSCEENSELLISSLEEEQVASLIHVPAFFGTIGLKRTRGRNLVLHTFHSLDDHTLRSVSFELFLWIITGHRFFCYFLRGQIHLFALLNPNENNHVNNVNWEVVNWRTNWDFRMSQIDQFRPWKDVW